MHHRYQHFLLVEVQLIFYRSMLLEKDRESLLKKCAEIDMVIKTNINLIPVNNWQFDSETMEEIREQKHQVVERHLTNGKCFLIVCLSVSVFV